MRQRFVAFVMIATQIALLEYMLFRFEYFPLVVGVIALAGAPGFVQRKLGRTAMTAALLALAVFILVGMQGFLFRGKLPVAPVLGGLAYPIGWYCLTVEAFLLFVKTKDGRLPVYFPLLGTTVMAYAGLAGRHGAIDPLYHGASILFVVMTILFWFWEKKPGDETIPPRVRFRGTVIQCVFLLVAMASACGLSTVVGVYRTGIDLAVFSMLGTIGEGGGVGFTAQTRLGSLVYVKNKGEEQVALRVETKKAPGYLRGRVYDSYEGGRWKTTASETRLKTSDAPGKQAYQIRDGSAPFESMTVRPTGKFEGCLFAPLDAAFIALVGVGPTGDVDGNLRVDIKKPLSDYEVITGAIRDEAADQREMTPPAKIDPGVRQLANQLYAGCGTTREKIAATVSYFRNNYKYQLGIEIPEGQDPLTYFLLKRPAAHCEYFASGAAILLRLGGVPTRYVTGFVADERNAWGKYWVARNKDAHAWVEAYDQERGAWVIVEATVADGVPGEDGEREAPWLAQLRDYAGYALQRMKEMITNGDWRHVLTSKLLLVVLLPMGFVALRSIFRALRGRERKQRRGRESLSVEHKALLRLRRRMDRQVRRKGFVRGPSETICDFADRIGQGEAAELQKAAEWYRLYNEVRFGCLLCQEKMKQLKDEPPPSTRR